MKVIWEMRTVSNPREMPKAMKASIREMPVTISAFSMGMLVIPMMAVRGAGRIFWMAMAAAVPIKVAIRAEAKATVSVVDRALMMERLSNIWAYHSRVKPPHWVLDFD